MKIGPIAGASFALTSTWDGLARSPTVNAQTDWRDYYIKHDRHIRLHTGKHWAMLSEQGGKQMFEGIKRRWAEARGAEAWKEVEDALQQWGKMNVNDQYFVTSAFANVISEIPPSLDDKEKAELAKGIMRAARKAFNTPGSNLMAHTSRISAYGGALVALYLECQTLPGVQAARVVATLRSWQQQYCA